MSLRIRHSSILANGLLLVMMVSFLSGCEEDPPVCPVEKSGEVSVVCLPDTLDGPWVLSLPGGLKAIGAGDSTLTDMPVGTYSIGWESLWNYESPEPDTVSLAEGSSIEILGTYTRPIRPTGSIELTINPSDATWSIEGSSWFATHGVGDVLLEDVPTGTYWIHFGPYPGYFTPSAVYIFLQEDEIETRTINYVPEPTLVFPDTPDKLMQNFQAIYELRNVVEYIDLMHDDFQTILQQSTIAEFPDVGETLDFQEEMRIHERMFSGQAVTDPNGDLVPGVANISFSRFIPLDAWAVSPPTDIIPNAEWALYDVEFLFDRGQTYTTLNVQGTIKFYVTSRDSMHQGSLRQYYQMIGQVDLTSSGLKRIEETNWGSVKALFR